MSTPVKVSDRGDGKLIARTEIDGKPVQVYRTRRGTVTIEVGDQPIYGLSTEGAYDLASALNTFLDQEYYLFEFGRAVGIPPVQISELELPG